MTDSINVKSAYSNISIVVNWLKLNVVLLNIIAPSFLIEPPRLNKRSRFFFKQLFADDDDYYYFAK